jgi:hypothetical protein
VRRAAAASHRHEQLQDAPWALAVRWNRPRYLCECPPFAGGPLLVGLNAKRTPDAAVRRRSRAVPTRKSTCQCPRSSFWVPNKPVSSAPGVCVCGKTDANKKKGENSRNSNLSNQKRITLRRLSQHATCALVWMGRRNVRINPEIYVSYDGNPPRKLENSQRR